MKKLLALTLISALFSSNIFADNKREKITVKNKSAQSKVYRHHQQNWHQRDYATNIVLFKCVDSWGHKLKGRFTQEQQYLIELGGGSCRRSERNQRQQANLSQIDRYDFPLSEVHQAISQIKHDYGVQRVKKINAEKVSAGRKNFKYTLVFKTQKQGYREFRVKHNRWTGNISAIYEV